MKRIFSIAAGLAYCMVMGSFIALCGGCTGDQPVACPPAAIQVKTVTVDVPVPVSCIPKDVSTAPIYPDTDAAITGALDAASRYRLLIDGKKLRGARADLLEALVSGCR